MKSKPLLAAAAIFLGPWSAVAEVMYLWDSNPIAMGAQDGSGIWNTDALNTTWVDGSLFSPSRSWPEILDDIYEARFGNGTATDDFTVTVDSVLVNNISFTGPGSYKLMDGVISFSFPGLGGQNFVAVAEGATGVIDSSMDGSSTSGDIVFVGGGTLELWNANSFGANDVLWLRDISIRANSSQAFGMGVLELQGPTATLIAGVDNLVFTNEVRLGGSAVANVFQVDSTKTMTLGGKLKNGPSVGGFSKMGAGTLILAGENTYGGNTVVSEGTLQVSASGAIDWSVAVEAAGVLDHHGIIYGPVSVAGGVRGSGSFEGLAVVAAGGVLRIDETDSLAFNAGLTLEEDAEIHFVLGSAPIKVNGALNLTGTAPILLTLSGDAFGDYSFIDFSGVENFALLPADAFALGTLPEGLEGTTLARYSSGYVLHAVPEPVTIGTLFLGLGWFGARRPRKK